MDTTPASREAVALANQIRHLLEGQKMGTIMSIFAMLMGRELAKHNLASKETDAVEALEQFNADFADRMTAAYTASLVLYAAKGSWPAGHA